MDIDKDTAIALLDKVVERNPDFVYRHWYEACMYVTSAYTVLPELQEFDEDGNIIEPPVPQCCIVGGVVLEAGADEESLGTIDGGVDEAAEAFFDHFGIDLDHEAVHFLGLAQAWQDNTDATWSEVAALAKAGLHPDNSRRTAIQEAVGRVPMKWGFDMSDRVSKWLTPSGRAN